MNEELITGPHVAAAFLCREVLREADGVMSFIRVVDRFTRAPGPGPDGQVVPIQVNVVVTLKQGDVPTGNYRIAFRVFKPNAMSHMAEMQNSAFFEGGPDRGVSVVAPFLMAADEEGLYWIDVLFEDVRVTRMPFRVIFANAPSVQVPK